MRVAAFQFDVRRDRAAENLAVVEGALREAAGLGCALVVLPELWPTSFADASDPTTRSRLLEESAAALARVAQLSRELELVVCGSSFAPAADATGLARVASEEESGGALPFNRLTVHDGGRVVLAYDKVHLFSPTAEDLGFSAGALPPETSDTRAGRLSGVVCYDLRFAETLRAPFDARAELLVCPAQWPDSRATHWRALVHGRAVEGQCFVVAANRTGVERVGRRSVELAFPGNSLVVDPHGRTLAEGRGETGLVVAEIDPDEARRTCVRVPVGKDRREELYGAWARTRQPRSESDSDAF